MRRVAAVVLPSLLVELAMRRRVGTEPSKAERSRAPLVVVLEEAAARAESVDDRTTIVAAVDPSARAVGLRPGLKLSEAHAMVAQIEVASVARTEVEGTLRALAEAALGFSPTVEVRPGGAVWIDVTGVAHLFGGEEELVRAIEVHMQAMGHDARVGLADGPRIAEALARYGHAARRIAAPGGGGQALAPLPLAALPLTADARAFFGRLGVLTVGDLAKLPRKQVAARLGQSSKSSFEGKSKKSNGQEVLLLVHGFDPRPLEPFVLPEHLEESVSFEDGVSFATQLLFAASGMTSRLEGRLRGRGQAAHRMEVVITYDRAIFALRSRLSANGSPGVDPGSTKVGDERNAAHVPDAQAPCVAAAVDFPAPLARGDDLFRTVKAKIEHLDIVAPVRSMTIVLRRLVTAPRFQLDLSRDVAVNPDALPALLSELVADLGAERVGVLLARNEILPERRSHLAPAFHVHGQHEAPRRARLRDSIGGRVDDARIDDADPEPVRLLASPLPVGTARLEGDRVWLDPSSSVHIGNETYRIDDVFFDRRIDAAHWWTSSSASRDYYRVMLRASQASKRVPERGIDAGATEDARDGSSPIVGGEAWVFVERRTGDVFLQGFWE